MPNLLQMFGLKVYTLLGGYIAVEEIYVDMHIYYMCALSQTCIIMQKTL